MNLDNLNEEQREAVTTTEGLVRVIAGAGCGKTRALTNRFAYLTQELGVQPGNILCVTFTNKSANEMRQRIRMIAGDHATGLITTFHGFCAGVLRKEGNTVGYPQNFPILDSSSINTILQTIYEERKLTLRDFTFKDAQKYFGTRKTIEEPEYCRDMVNMSLSELKARYDAATDIHDVLFYGYIYKSRKSFALDYCDLIHLTLMIFKERPEICALWQKKLEYVMVDEFQDIDPQQYELIEVLTGHHHNLFVVGDPDQTIYTWRGADVNFFLDFEKRFQSAKTIVMYRNYRSTPEILSVANSLIEKNKQRFPKKLVAMNPSGQRVLYRRGKDTADEIGWIVKKMKSLHASSVPFAQMAILYRSHYVTREIEPALSNAEIPYTIYSGVQFYDRAEVKDALSYLRLVYAKDDLSFLRVANTPKRNLGKKRMAFLKERAEENKCTLYEMLKSSLDAGIMRGTKAKDLVDLVERYQNSADTPSELLAHLLDESGYEGMLRTEGAQARLDNLTELKNGICKYEETCGEECSVADYLAYVSLFADSDSDAAMKDSVKLMTVHAAKGLEFPYVFLCSLNDGVFPARKIKNDKQMEEERRLAFVAITRAEKALFLSSSGGRDVDGAPRFPSPLLNDIDKGTFDQEVPPHVAVASEPEQKLEQPKAEPTPTDSIVPAFSIGERVEHKIFGQGVVEDIDSKEPKVQVRFDKLATTRCLSASALTHCEKG